jgi:predicted phosphodiesterase
MGNHDVEAIEPPREANPANPDDVYMQWTRSQLSEESRSFLASFQDAVTISRAGSSISLTHGCFPHPLGPLGLPTRLLRGKLRRAGRAYRKIVFPHWSSRIWPDTHDSVFRSIRRAFPADIVIVAHSHVQFERQAGGARFINPGSVGQPRLGQPLATYVVIEDDEFRFRGVPYDFEATCAALDEVPVDASFKRVWQEAYRAGRVPDRYAIREWDSLIEAGYR